METHRQNLAAKPCPSWGDLWCDQPQPTQEQPQSSTFEATSLFWSANGALPHMNSHPLSKSRAFVTTKNWSLEQLLKSGDRFHSVPRLSAFDPSLEASIAEYERNGIPLIIESYHQHPQWPGNLFSIEGFCVKSRKNVITTRNVRNGTDRDFFLSEFVEKSRAMPPFATPDEPERLYGKDASCPPEWNEWLHNAGVLPSSLLPDGSNNMLLNVPKSERVKTLMCYLGVGDTFTPCHKDLCASSGQNIMCYTENSGSSFWFMTASSDASAVASYFHKLKQELDHETYIISVEELAAAPFDVYIAEQKLGDMVLVPPRSCHQVVNYGGVTIKTSWSRMTINGLTAAIYHELPIYRRVCRPETYRIKYTLYLTLLSHTTELENLYSRTAVGDIDESSSASIRDSSACARLPVSTFSTEQSRKEYLTQDYWRLITLFDDVIVEEYCQEHSSMPCLASSPNAFGDKDDRITCDFCCADIFQSFFECCECVKAASPTHGDHPSFQQVGLGDGLIICPTCYVEGRSCQCEVMTAVQCRPFEDLLQVRRRAVNLMISMWEDHTLNNVSLVGEQQLLSEDRLGIFRAAYLFQRTRKQNQGTRSCRLRDSSHIVSFTSALSCKKCHSSKCFQHMLQNQGIHSAEAILSQRKDDGNEAWHRRHSKPDIVKAKAEVLCAERSGTRLDLRHQLAKMASTFPICNPARVTLIKLGWYDKMIPILDIPARNIEMLSPLSSLTPSPVLSSKLLPDCLDMITPESSSSSLLMNNDEESVKQSLIPEYSATSDKSGNDRTPEYMNISVVPAFRPASIQRTATKKRRRGREILDCVLVQSVALVWTAQNHATLTSRIPDQPGDRQLVPFSTADNDGDTTVTRRSRKSLNRRKGTSSLSLTVTGKVGPPTKRTRLLHRRRRSLSAGQAVPLVRKTSTVDDERPLKESRFRRGSSAASDIAAYLPVVRERKPGSLPKFHKVSPSNSVSEAGPSNAANPNRRGHRSNRFQHTVEKFGEDSVQALNKAFQNNGLLKVELSPGSPMPRDTDKKLVQVIEKQVVDGNAMLRKDIERFVEDMKSTSFAKEREIARLQMLLSLKNAEIEELHAEKANQIIMPDFCSLVGHFLDKSANMSPNAGSHHGRLRSPERSAPSSRQRRKHRYTNRHPSFGYKDPGTSVRFQGGRRGFGGESHSSDYRGLYDGMSSPSRGHYGRSTQGFEAGRSNHRGYLERIPDRPRQAFRTHEVDGGFSYRDTYRSVESYGLPTENPRDFLSRREIDWEPPRQLSPNPEISVAQVNSFDPKTGIVPLENGQTSQGDMQTSFNHERDMSFSVSDSPAGPTGSEYWEDDYEQSASHQRGPSAFQDSSPQIEKFGLQTYGTVPLLMESNPWVE